MCCCVLLFRFSDEFEVWLCVVLLCLNWLCFYWCCCCFVYICILYVLLSFCVDVVGLLLSVVCCVVLFVVIPFSFILILFIVGC